MQGMIGARGQPPVHVDQVLHAGDLGGQDDPVVGEAGLLGQLRGPDGALHDGVHGDVARVPRLGELRVGSIISVRRFWSRLPQFTPMRTGLPLSMAT